MAVGVTPVIGVFRGPPKLGPFARPEGRAR